MLKQILFATVPQSYFIFVFCWMYQTLKYDNQETWKPRTPCVLFPEYSNNKQKHRRRNITRRRHAHKKTAGIRLTSTSSTSESNSDVLITWRNFPAQGFVKFKNSHKYIRSQPAALSLWGATKLRSILCYPGHSVSWIPCILSSVPWPPVSFQDL